MLNMMGNRTLSMAQAEEIISEPSELSVPELKETQTIGIELTLRKLSLAALTMLGVGYVVANAPVIILLGYSWSTIPLSSQANIAAISGRILFILASAISSVLGVVFVFNGVRFYEGRSIKGTAFLGLLLASFYLLCLGLGSIVLLQGEKPSSFLLLVGPILAMISAAVYMVPRRRFRLVGSILGTISGGMLAYAFFDVRTLELAFNWGIAATGPFMSFLTVESVVIVLGSVVALGQAILGNKSEEKPLKHLLILLVALVYGVGVFIGSLILSMSLWDLIWKSPWTGPLNGLPSWVMNIIMFWSASLFLPAIGGIILIVASCLGFGFVAQEFPQF